MADNQISFYKFYLPIASFGILYYFYKFLVKFDKRSEYWNTILFIAILFPFCKVLQILVIGPRFFRHHLTDFGFIPMFALTIWLFPLLKGKINFRYCLKLALMFALITESMQIILTNATANIKFDRPVAAGDYIDIFMFISSYYICKILYYIYRGEIKVAS